MSWHFSQALVAEYSAASCLDGERFAPLNLTPTPQAYCSPDRMTVCSRLSRFGMTFAPLMEARGEELLTWFLAGFPARTSAQPEKALDSTESEAASGWKWRESSVKYDRASRSWRTRQCSLLAGLDEFSGTWPKWGSMRDGECWELPTLAHRTNETGSGLLPTPRASMGKHGIAWARAESGDHRHQLEDYMAHLFLIAGGQRISGAVIHPCFAEEIMMWPQHWTALDALETDKCQSAPLKRGAC